MKTRKVTATIEPISPTHDEIAGLAYARWQQRGRPTGKDLEFWLEAERDLSASNKSRPFVHQDDSTYELEQFEHQLHELLSEYGMRPGRRSPTAL
jgi:hypothetical protein